ncbi:hypothetical protein [Flavobacterium cellulosilyticum]|uniref:hypothetical protein n=1 Tax=Flavobacterium cellulosilyticum TaxID=2541731 RepID=UPI001FE59A7E|nr:hypothetical protein [Flavobacterium cellulosilyticum]
MSRSFVENYQSLNLDFWEVYYKVGLNFYHERKYTLAQIQFEKALTKEITTLPEIKAMEKYLKKIKRKLQ